MGIALSYINQSARLVGDVITNAFGVVRSSVLAPLRATQAVLGAIRSAMGMALSYINQSARLVGDVITNAFGVVRSSVLAPLRATQAVVDAIRSAMGMALSYINQSARLVGGVITNAFGVVRSSVLCAPHPAAVATLSTISCPECVESSGRATQAAQRPIAASIRLRAIVLSAAMCAVVATVWCTRSARRRAAQAAQNNQSLPQGNQAPRVAPGQAAGRPQGIDHPPANDNGIGACDFKCLKCENTFSSICRGRDSCAECYKCAAQNNQATPQRNQAPRDPPGQAAPRPQGHHPPPAPPHAAQNNQATPQRNQAPRDPPGQAAHRQRGRHPHPNNGIGAYHFECPKCGNEFSSICSGRDGWAECYLCNNAKVPPVYKLPHDEIQRTSNKTHSCNACSGVGSCPVVAALRR